MTSFTAEEMRKRFHENRAQREAILAKSVPLRAERDKLSQETDRRLKELADQIRDAENGLYELDNEAGMLVRALNGKTGKLS